MDGRVGSWKSHQIVIIYTVMVGPLKTNSLFVFCISAAFCVFMINYACLVIYTNSVLVNAPFKSANYGVSKIDRVYQRIIHYYDNFLSGMTGEDNKITLPFSENPSWFYDKLTRQEMVYYNHDSVNITAKKILYWNPSGKPYMYLGPGTKTWFRDIAHCPVWQCDIYVSSENSSKTIPVEDYDALLFYDTKLEREWPLPVRRSPHQYYIWFNREAPGYLASIKKWNKLSNVFNWTVTYRWDSSDILFPYGYFRPLWVGNDSHKLLEKENYAEGKSKLAIWFVSHCDAHNGRSDYVERLQRYIPVDIYGGCGPFKCAHVNQSECRAMMERDYKFVIAFENSLCWDYVTEKLFYNMKFNIVPIVLDLHGNYVRLAPAGSYINALDFPSVKELADYLQVLDRNDTLYNQYFRWREQYVVNDSTSHRWNETDTFHLCNICKKLHDPPRSLNIVKNITKWWNDDAKCKVIQFPSERAGIENDAWIAKDYNPPAY